MKTLRRLCKMLPHSLTNSLSQLIPLGAVGLVFCAGSCFTSAATADQFEVGLLKLVEQTTAAVKETGKRKVAVVSFTTIDGTVSKFGRFLSDQLSTGMVIASKDFTVVDRAHLHAILDEHKLTEDKLVKPENARALGEFSGVDALVIGTITSVESGHLITVKVISTDKAEIAAAVRTKLSLNPDFDTIRPSSPNGKSTPPSTVPKAVASRTPTTSPPVEREANRVFLKCVHCGKRLPANILAQQYKADGSDPREVIEAVQQTGTLGYASKVSSIICPSCNRTMRLNTPISRD